MKLFNTPACCTQSIKSFFIVAIFFACMLFANSANAQAAANGNTPQNISSSAAQAVSAKTTEENSTTPPVLYRATLASNANVPSGTPKASTTTNGTPAKPMSSSTGQKHQTPLTLNAVPVEVFPSTEKQ